MTEIRLIKVDVGQNNNKFWTGILDGSTVTLEWGRVGKKPQSKVKEFCSSYEASDFFDSKRREKERKGYKALQTVDSGSVSLASDKLSLKKIAKAQIKGASVLSKLLDYLVDRNAHDISTATGGRIVVSGDVVKTPLGIVTDTALKQAENVLSNIADLVTANDFSYAMERKANEYLTLVPQDFGMGRLNVRSFFGSPAKLQRQQALLDSLEASLQAIATKAIDDNETVFDVELNEADTAIVADVSKLYEATKNASHTSHNLKVKTVYSVSLPSSQNAFETALGNVRRLWHGTRVSNVLSILRDGLIVPPAHSSHCTGRMFGNGLYFSDQSTKALNYSYGYWGGSRDNNCFMFLADVAMGKAFKPQSRCGQSYPANGYDSTDVKGGTAGVINNEMIVYRTSQANLVYLVEFTG